MQLRVRLIEESAMFKILTAGGELGKQKDTYAPGKRTVSPPLSQPPRTSSEFQLEDGWV